jgi:hypothetical protein
LGPGGAFSCGPFCGISRSQKIVLSHFAPITIEPYRYLLCSLSISIFSPTVHPFATFNPGLILPLFLSRSIDGKLKGVFNKDDVKAELTELARGQHNGRQTEAEITVFKTVGTALSDLAAACLVVEKLTNLNNVE